MIQTFKSEVKVIKSYICDYSDPHILEIRDITAAGGK